MDLRMYVCRKADPETKGRVENLVGYNKDNFLSTRDFIKVDEANKSVGKWLKRRANGKISQATKKIPAEKKLYVFDVFTGIQIVEYDLSLIPGEIIKNRNFLRDTEKKSSELKKNVLEMFDLKNWQIFVEENYKKFPRYVRDQCSDAKKYFGNKKIYEAILDKALEYCIKQ